MLGESKSQVMRFFLKSVSKGDVWRWRVFHDLAVRWEKEQPPPVARADALCLCKGEGGRVQVFGWLVKVQAVDYVCWSLVVEGFVDVCQ